ncbi:copper resistance protein NlpE [Massilibacteroides sp.]|uniref:copper resistance protein NlpE n=1 Tax=Massilibacteroides sp. TaxID=2034766 RepID=UPI0026230A31|nr:copper resistance protein NlpE [Massilibacteroides sp.]MDD4514645.1 copper resistance protein NlpE [Massilibacteroides sp.]
MLKKISLFAFILIFVSCGQKAKQADDTNATTPPATEVAPVPDGHNAQNSLDYVGTYKGILPCGDCEGIETILVIETEDQFTKKTRYLGKENSPFFEESGTYSWNEAGNTIELVGVADAPNKYFVGENQLFQLDMEGERITGNLADKYILKKEQD